MKHMTQLKNIFAFAENVDQPHFVFLVTSKLLKTVIFLMEEYKDTEERIVESIRKAFKRYICTQEVGERQHKRFRALKVNIPQ